MSLRTLAVNQCCVTQVPAVYQLDGSAVPQWEAAVLGPAVRVLENMLHGALHSDLPQPMPCSVPQREDIEGNQPQQDTFMLDCN